MKQRLIVAAVGVPLLLVILLAAPPEATVILCTLLAVVGCWELIHAVGGEGACSFGNLGLCCVLAGLNTIVFSYPDKYPAAVMGAACMITATVGFLAAILSHGKKNEISFAALMAALFGAVAVPAAFSALSLLRFTSPALAIAPLVGAFMSDTGAFFAGRAFGKRKLAPAVSPNKTVAGCIGGFAGSIAGMAVFALVARWTVSLELAWWLVLLMGVLGSLFGQIGDLSFSVIKREYDIKDYGKIFPGHGGVLDRFDSVLFVAPVYWLLLGLVF